MKIVVHGTGSEEGGRMFADLLRQHLPRQEGVRIEVHVTEAPIPTRLEQILASAVPPIVLETSPEPAEGMDLDADVCEIETEAPLDPEFDILFYDGGCGLCHRSVEFAAGKADVRESFLFAPLFGETYGSLISSDQRASLPDSLLVRTKEGALLTKSSAVAYILDRAGGVWSIAAKVLNLLPEGIRNVGYDLVARIRSRLFEKPRDVCPMLPPDVRDRFMP